MVFHDENSSKSGDLFNSFDGYQGNRKNGLFGNRVRIPSFRNMICHNVSLLSLCLALFCTTLDARDGETAAAVLRVENLVSFWRFQEEPGTARVAEGRFEAVLLEGNEKPVARANEGLFGEFSLSLKQGEWLRIPREKLGPLDIHGPEAQVTLIAWVKREANSYWQAVAGVWNESHSGRQYMLFLNARAATDSRTLDRVDCKNRIHGHISALGGKTPGHEVWKQYASGASEVPMSSWHMLAMTYDSKHIRLYLDGKLDAWEHFNPFPYDEGIFDGGENGSEFTVGANHVREVENNNPFGGKIAGLAVFDRALDEDELAELARKTLPERE